jgi:dTDP-4-amino-4,6-dideoxygalactose transaminase
MIRQNASGTSPTDLNPNSTSMLVRLRDLSVNDPVLRETLHTILDRMMDHGIWILGHEVEVFEHKIAQHCSRNFAVGVSSASSGLYLGLRALGLGPGDEVITTPMSWLMTSTAVALVGATPVFVDVDEDFNIDPERVSEAINSRTRAILPVDFYGRMARLPEMTEIANEHSLLLIEDLAQSFGASIKEAPAGSFGDMGIASFSPMKILGGLGDAGVIVFDDESLLEKLKMLRHSGTINSEICMELEIKHMIDAINAAVITERVPSVHLIIDRRRELAERYIDQIGEFVRCPSLGAPGEHTIYDFTICAVRRNELAEHLRSKGIEVKVRHPILIPDQPALRGKHRIVGQLTRAQGFLDQILCLPMHQNLSESDVDTVCNEIRNFYA